MVNQIELLKEHDIALVQQYFYFPCQKETNYLLVSQTSQQISWILLYIIFCGVKYVL